MVAMELLKITYMMTSTLNLVEHLKNLKILSTLCQVNLSGHSHATFNLLFQKIDVIDKFSFGDETDGNL